MATVAPEAGRGPVLARVAIGEGVLGPATEVAVITDPTVATQAPKEKPRCATALSQAASASPILGPSPPAALVLGVE